MYILETSNVGANGHAPNDPTPWYPLTDYGNAERLLHWHGRDVRHVRKWGKWLVWNGRYWEPDETGEIIRRAKLAVRQMLIDAALIEKEAVRKSLKDWQTKTESQSGIANMIKLAETETGIPVDPTELDSDPYLFCVENGVIDLRTGEFRKHDRKDLLTKCAPVTFDPDAECPTYRKFITTVVPNDNVLEFLNRAIGYSLTADVSEHCLFFLYGSGRNGKSTLMNLMRSILGPYGKQGTMSLLMAKNSEGHPCDVADLIGARVVLCSEIDQGKKLAEGLVKQLTSEEPINARFMRQNFFEFTPTHKPWLAANHKPIIMGQDLGIWRRIKLIPFTTTIPLVDVDHRLAQKLWAERSGILNDWLMGCREWREMGLGEPSEITAAVNEYRAEMDTLGDWLTENCTLEPSLREGSTELYKNYLSWCELASERPISKRSFGQKLSDRGLSDKRGTGGKRQWSGLAITSTIPLGMTFDTPNVGENVS